MYTTAKFSRDLLNAIDDRARRGESKDNTLRRLLIGEEPRPRKSADAPIVVVKLSRSVRNFIRRHSRPRESVDDTVRRLFTSFVLKEA